MTITYINPLAVDPLGAFAAKTNISQTYTANETFQTITVGSGSRGVTLQQHSIENFGLYSTSVTPGLGNFSLRGDGVNTFVNCTGGQVSLSNNNVPILTATSNGVSITGTLTIAGSTETYSINNRGAYSIINRAQSNWIQVGTINTTLTTENTLNLSNLGNVSALGNLSVSNTISLIASSGSINAYSLNGGSSVTSLNIVSVNSLAGVGINLTNANANMLTAGTNSAVSITQTYNQASGTAANTDLLINRTETAVGSGGQSLIDAQVGGVSKFKVDNIGTVRITGDFNCDGGVATGGNINIIVGYNGAYRLNGHSIVSTVVPTISSGFGTTPSIVIANGTAAFQVNVGSGGTATSGILTMPPAATGWAVTCTNPLVAAGLMVVIDPTSTTSVTISCKTISTNAMAAFPANIVLTFHAHGF